MFRKFLRMLWISYWDQRVIPKIFKDFLTFWYVETFLSPPKILCSIGIKLNFAIQNDRYLFFYENYRKWYHFVARGLKSEQKKHLLYNNLLITNLRNFKNYVLCIQYMTDGVIQNTEFKIGFSSKKWLSLKKFLASLKLKILG